MRVFISSAELAMTKTKTSYLRIRYVGEDKVQKTAVLFDSDKKPEDIGGKVCEVSLTEAKPSNKIEAIDVVEGADVSPFLKTTTLDVKAMLADLKEWTRGDGVDPAITKIVDHVLFQGKGRPERFSEWPAAASNHHAFRGGLIEHTWAMAKIAKTVMATDPAAVGLDVGVVMGAIVMHDLAKIFTYDFQNGKSEKTNLDVLLGHISIADEIVVKACVAENIPTAKGVVLNLRHCILSHHGIKEWGSPVVPSTREAVLIHQIDMLQARNEMAVEAVEGVEKGKRSAWSSTLETEMINL